jgi:serine/threonine protein kinase
MPAPSTADDFLALVSRSGVLDPQALQAYILDRRLTAALPASPKELADALVHDGLLTRFQAEQLLQGKWRNFFLSGKYKILERLGSGGMASVFLCEHMVMRRRVALKVLPTARAGEPASLERFHREGRAAAHLHHPNIVAAYDIDRDGKVHFLVMEYIDGSSLDKIVRIRGPMDYHRAAHYIRQAALGLQHAHEAGLVHRDIKPSNLLLDRTGTVKVLDMGLALFFRDEADDLTREQGQGVLGTTDYMAPEQAQDSHTVDGRADIYSLGATFYFLLTGRSPFKKGAARKPAGSAGQQPQPVREVRPDLPEGLVDVVERMLAKDPARRYQTAANVAEALLPWAGTPIPPPGEEEMPRLSPAAWAAGSAGDSLATPTPAWVGATPPAPSARPGERASGAPSREPPAADVGVTGIRRRRWIAMAGAAAGLVVACVLGFAIYHATKDGKPPGDSPPAEASPHLRLLVPAYFYPGGDGLKEWDRLIDSADATGLVAIVNPASGPGKEADRNFVQVMDRARTAGITLIGYVSTAHAKRPLPEVEADVERWVRFYPRVDGIFFDEQASGADQVDYYAALYDQARKLLPRALVVTNPGTLCAEEYLSRPAADVACLAEVSKSFADYRVPSWAGRYTANRFCALIRGITKAELMKEYIREMPDKAVGYCYITQTTGPNPWDRLPPYWEAEVAAVQRVNERHAP